MILIMFDLIIRICLIAGVIGIYTHFYGIVSPGWKSSIFVTTMLIAYLILVIGLFANIYDIIKIILGGL